VLVIICVPMAKQGVRLTDSQIESILKLIKQGTKPELIAVSEGCSVRTIYNIARKNAANKEESK
jgi:DNA invertase Pin-like site-specific DNA recombinase